LVSTTIRVAANNIPPFADEYRRNDGTRRRYDRFWAQSGHWLNDRHPKRTFVTCRRADFFKPDGPIHQNALAAIGPNSLSVGLANLENNLPDSIYDDLWLVRLNVVPGLWDSDSFAQR
jgi:hypothetical protein